MYSIWQRRGIERYPLSQQRRLAVLLHHLDRSLAFTQNPRRPSSTTPLVPRQIRRYHQRRCSSLPRCGLLLLLLAVLRPHRRRDRPCGLQLGRCRPCHRWDPGIRLLLPRWREEQVRGAGQPCCQGFVRVVRSPRRKEYLGARGNLRISSALHCVNEDWFSKQTLLLTTLSSICLVFEIVYLIGHIVFSIQQRG
jgi:hypothetical protein